MVKSGVSQRRSRLSAACLAACVTVLGLVTEAATAADESPYTVSKIAVDVTAKSAVAAKAEAMAAAEQRAANIVLRRVTPFNAHAQLPALDPQQVEGMVSGLSIRKEQYSTTRYIASLDIILNQQAVKQLLTGLGLPISDERAPMISVLPLVMEGDKVKTGGNDDWQQAWLDLDLTHSLTPANIMRARSDLDAGTVRAVLAGDVGAYASLQGDYGSAPLVIAIGQQVDGGQFVTRLAGADSVGRINYGRAEQLDAGRAKAKTGDAAALAYALLENRWKVTRSSGTPVEPVRYEEGVPAAAAPQGEPARSVVAMVPFSGLKEWQDIRARLTQVPGVQGLEINSLSPRMASVGFDFAGSLGLLQKVLGEYGFAFENRAEGFVVRAR